MLGKAAFSLTILSLAAAAPPALADDDWAGLYMGIDARDGSIDYVSIVPTGDGTYEVRTRVSEHSMCSTAGLVVATAREKDDGLVRENIVVRCDGSDTTIEVSDTAYGLDDDILSLKAPDDGRMLYFHRISRDD